MRYKSVLLWATSLSPLGFSGVSCGGLDQEVLSEGNDLGAVASESIECSRIGRSLIAKGGNAVDALVGTQFCVGVVGMYHSGIGGGGFAVVRDGNGTYEVIDFRETGPAAASQNMFRKNPKKSIFGGLAAGVPGEVKGLEYLHNKYGVLPWADVVMPSSRLASEGFVVSADLVRYMFSGMKEAGSAFLQKDSTWAEDFAPNGTLLELGDTITRKRYAKTLETIANAGAEAFYQGPLAASFVKTVQDAGGVMTLEDMISYRVEIREALNTTYRGYKLYTAGVPAGGSICLNILKIMEQYDPADDADRGLKIHRFDEAMRFAYGARLLLGDPAFVEGMDAYESMIISEASAKDAHARIRDNTTLPVREYIPHEMYAADNFGTSHVVTADASGLAATLTSTVNLLFGAVVMDPTTGVIVNNEMNDFSIPGTRNAFGYEPSVANFIRPGKRPLSSSSPVIVERADGSLYVSVGAAGGSRIISSTTQVLWHILDNNMTMAEALREPRLHDQLMPNQVLVEPEFDEDLIASLESRGHDIVRASGLSAVQGLRVLEDGVFEAASEPRQKNSGAETI